MSNTATTESGTALVCRLRATVRGRVQGVGFRYWTHHTAQKTDGIHGFVRNLPDGSVEVEAEGTDRAVLEKLLLDLHRGPSTAHVEGVEVFWEENAAPRHSGFRVA